MPTDYNQDVIAIREWMTKEPHMPQDIEDEVIKKFLHGCYGSLEKTKRCLDNFCSGRSRLTELYTSRDPLSPNVKTAFSITVVTVYQFKEKEILIHKYDDPTTNKFSCYDLMKAVTMQLDHWIKYLPTLPEAHCMIVDMECYALKMISKINVMYLRDFIVYLLSSMPVRLKQVYVVNVPSYYETLYAIIKPVFPADSYEMVHFFTDYESLHKYIDKKYLPSEYGGEAQSMYERNQQWLKKIEEDRELFLNENLWKADLSKKPKSSGDHTMEGSFRQLAID